MMESSTITAQIVASVCSIQNDGTFNNYATVNLDVGGSFYNGGGSDNRADIENTGTISIGEQGLTIMNWGVINNNGGTINDASGPVVYGQSKLNQGIVNYGVINNNHLGLLFNEATG
ncbi:MAG: hypothetical protein ACREBS_01060 [Nitrososphaerales archaeon]